MISGRRHWSIINQCNNLLYILGGAQYLTTSFIGSVTGGHLDVHTWRIRGPGYNAKITVSGDNCSPMAESIYGIEPNGGGKISYCIVLQ